MDPDPERLRSEVAHVLFLDMEGYSRLSLEDQARDVHDLRELVRTTQEFTRCEAAGDLLRSDTGDGMALVFFRDPQSPIRCACEIAEALGHPPRLPVRIGLHSGPIIRTHDINGRENVSGGGINLAQRVMDCGGAGHILLSRSYADLLTQFGLWASDLHDLGEFPVKHGLHLSLVSFHRDDCGNPRPPARLRAPAPAAPTNLPFWRTDQFVGRLPTLALIRNLLQSAAPVALVGLSGLGKTLLALQYAHLHAYDYPGGVFWINAADSSHLKEDYATLGRSFFDIPETLSTESCVARLRDRLHHLTHPALFVFDNVTEDTDLSLLPTSPQCRLLLTTQQKHLAPPGFELVPLPKLDPDAALSLLHGPDAALSDDERAAARQIADAVGRLPLALALIAQHRARLGVGFVDYRRRSLAPPTAAYLPEQKLLHVLERAREKFVTVTSHKGNIYETIERVYLSLDPAARTVLAAAACFAPAGLGRDLLLEVLEPEGEDAWEEALADLADAFLISEDEPSADAGESIPQIAPRLRLHELFRTFARVQLSAEQHHTYVTRLAHILTGRLEQSNDGLDWRGVRSELPHLTYMASECRLLELPERLYPLLIALGRYLFMHRDFVKSEAHLREGLALVEHLHGAMYPGRAQILRDLSELEQMQGSPSEALRDGWTALCIAKRLHRADDPDLPIYYTVLGFILKEQKQYRRARIIYEKVRRLYVGIYGLNHPEVAEWLNNLAMLCIDQGQAAQAENYLREALQIEENNHGSDGPTAKIAIYWNNLGRALGLQGEWAQAAEHHRTALAIDERLHGENHPRVASCLFYLAGALQALHQWDEAWGHYERVLSLYQRFYGSSDYRCNAVRVQMALIEKERNISLT